MFVYTLNLARAREEVTVCAPLVAEWTTEIASFGRYQLHDSRGAQLETPITNRNFKVFAPLLLTPLPAPVEAGEVQVIPRRVMVLHQKVLTVA
jgi:hypothetical protein